jgi:hypothetical protein
LPEVLTRRFGGVPLWAILGLGGAALVGFVIWRRRSGNASSTGGSVVNNPAASSIPYVPSVTVTGVPPLQPSANQPGTITPPSGTTQQLIVSPGPYAPPGGTFLRSSPTPPATGNWGGILVPAGTRLTQNGTAQTYNDPQLGPVPMIPVSYLGSSYWVSSYDVTPVSGSGDGSGFGGWGSQGQTTPQVAAMMGWTSGWAPVGGAGGSPLYQGWTGPGGQQVAVGRGASATTNRQGKAKTKTRVRRTRGGLFGRGGGSSTQRQGADRGRRRRSFTGR